MCALTLQKNAKARNNFRYSADLQIEIDKGRYYPLFGWGNGSLTFVCHLERMARRSDIPPSRDTHDENLGPDSSDEAIEVFAAVQERLFPAIERILRKQLPEVDAEQVLEAAGTLALLYIGQRVGDSPIIALEAESQTLDLREHDQTPALVGALLDDLTKLVGERQASEIFRRLRRDTDRAIENYGGRSR